MRPVGSAYFQDGATAFLIVYGNFRICIAICKIKEVEQLLWLLKSGDRLARSITDNGGELAG